MKLSLYEYPSCPYCGLVLRSLDALDVEVELCDVEQDRERLRELVEGTGRTQVPCLRIESDDGRVEWMHESRDIVHYLQGLS
jgi:glutaredoxin